MVDEEKIDKLMTHFHVIFSINAVLFYILLRAEILSKVVGVEPSGIISSLFSNISFELFFPICLVLNVIALIKGFKAAILINPKHYYLAAYDPLAYKLKYYKPYITLTIPVIAILEILIRLEI